MATHFHCCVPSCVSDSRYDKEKLLSFHRIPKEPSLRKAWIVKIRRDVGHNFQITGNTRVCSRHFLPNVFLKTLAGLRKLKAGAIPTEFTWTTNMLTPKRRPLNRQSALKAIENEEPATPMSQPCESEKVSTPCSSKDHDYECPKKTAEEIITACHARIEQLEKKISEMDRTNFFLERFSHDNANILFYTGFKDYPTFKAVFFALQPTATTMVRWSQVQRNRQIESLQGDVFRDELLPLIDQFFMFMCRLRQGFFEQDLAVRFSISQSTVSRILITWSNYLYFMLGSLPIWCSRSVIQKEMPLCFKETYPKTRVILDATEIRVQKPSSKVLNSETYSNYKSHTTFKSLLGISPFGAVTFVSSLYTGCISDKEITNRCGIIDLLETDDEVMADKGFLINDLLQAKKAKLVIPPFLGCKGKFTKREVSETHEIARLRIHVERAIRRIKEYHIFDSVIPLTLAGSVNQLWTIAAVLTNFKGPLF